MYSLLEGKVFGSFSVINKLVPSSIRIRKKIVKFVLWLHCISGLKVSTKADNLW